MPTRVVCGECQQELPSDDINVGEGVAYCRSCGTLTRLADLLSDAESGLDAVDAAIPPDGCMLRDVGLWTSVRSTGRSVAGAAFFLFFAIFWNGITSIFVCVALADTLRLIFGSVPAWFPSPTGNGTSFGSGAGGLIFMWLFLTPFILIGIGTAIAALTMLFGRVEVRIRNTGAYAFTGIGPFGWKRRFNASDVESVRIGTTTWKQNNRAKEVIEIRTGSGKVVRVGSILTEQRRAWMTKVLRELLVAS